jgi:hypothetical protein
MKVVFNLQLPPAPAQLATSMSKEAKSWIDEPSEN